MHAIIINRKSRKDRYDHIVTQLDCLPIETYEFLVATEDYPVDHPNWMKGWGCLESHYRSIQIAKEKKLPYVLILEDDAVFETDAKNYFIKSFNDLENQPWDMFFLGSNLQGPATSITENLLRISKGYCTHAYMVNEKMYDVILDTPKIWPIDVLYKNHMDTSNVYMCDPIIAYQIPTYSDIEKKFTDYKNELNINYQNHKIK